MTSTRDVLREAVDDLGAAGVDSPRLDARLLLGHVLGREVWPHEDISLDDDDLIRFRHLISRRRRREPVSRIVGRRGFWNLDLKVGPATLDPRPDSETLIEAAVSLFSRRPPPAWILDLGTGTGCLLLAALQAFPDAQGVGIDLSPDAVGMARANAAGNGLAGRARFETAGWSEFRDPRAFDLVLSNPPYIAEADIAGLDPEVRDFDPRLALAAGQDGLDAYRQLAAVLPRVLARQGVAVLEFGEGQGGAVEALMEPVGLRTVERRSDLAGIDRALVLQRNDTRSSHP